MIQRNIKDALENIHQNKRTYYLGFRLLSKNDAEVGRSMLEMLGVLAVMGVLSVGGVAMYTTAMNKHRANELLNEASKRAAIVAMQITAGRTEPSIAEFDNTLNGGTFGTPGYMAGDKTFTLPLTGVDEDVCTQMKTAVGDNTLMAITGDCGSDLTLTFNADLSRGVDISGTQPINCPDGTTCPSNQVCCPNVFEGVVTDWSCETESDCPRTSESCTSKGMYWITSCDDVDFCYNFSKLGSPC